MSAVALRSIGSFDSTVEPIAVYLECLRFFVFNNFTDDKAS